MRSTLNKDVQILKLKIKIRIHKMQQQLNHANCQIIITKRARYRQTHMITMTVPRIKKED